MTHAYTEGLHQALHAAAWLAGVLTVLLWVAACLALLLLVAARLSLVLRPWWASRTLRRSHARSGRLTGPQ